MNRYILTLAVLACLLVGHVKAQKNDLNKGTDAYLSQQYELAIRYFNGYLQENRGGIPLILFRRGDCFLKTGQYAKAIADFNEVLKLSPTYNNAYYNRGLAYQKLGQYEMAIRDFKKEIAQVEKDNISTKIETESLRRISECYNSMGAYAQANSYAEMAQEHETISQSAIELQTVNQQVVQNNNNVPTNRPTGQQQITGTTVKTINSSLAAQLLSEARTLTEIEKYAEAEEKCTQIINYYKEIRKQAFDWRGMVRIRMKKYNDAIQDFNQSLMLNAADAWTFNQRGLAKMEAGLLNEAEQDFYKAIELDNQSPAKENLAILNIQKRNSVAKDDKKGPQVTIVSPQLPEVNSRGLSVVSAADRQITITGIVEDPSGVREVQLNTTFAKLTPSDGTGQRFQFTATIPIKEYGENTIYFVAKDAANNETKKLYKYTAYSPEVAQKTQMPATGDDKSEAKSLLGRNYALLIGIEEYQYWDRLYNPVRDVNAIAQELKNNYGFEVDLLVNPRDKYAIQRKISEWANRNYQPQDQLFVFIAGHGYFIPHLEKGFIIPFEGIPAHMEKNGESWLSHDFIRNTLEHSNCRHIFLVMDACFSGTFSPAVARNRGANELSLSMREIVARKIQLKTRKYLTSGGKEYVSDGHPGAHSPFASELLKALRDKGKFTGGLLTVNDIRRAVQNLKPNPHSGDFPNSSSEPESDFFFIPVN